MRKSFVMLAVLLAIGVLGVRLSAKTAIGLTLHVQGMEAYVGQRFEIRLIEGRSGLEVERVILSAVAASSFDITFSGTLSGTIYRLAIAADANRNGRYDPPPTDHAWQLDVLASDDPLEVSFLPREDFVDVGWENDSTVPLAIVDGIVETSEYTHAAIDSATGIEMRWANDAERLYVALISPGTGWVAVGFDPESAMQGANYILATVADGRTVIEDHYGTSRFGHRLDESQDVLYAAGIERESQTTVEFVIPLSSGDSWDKPLRSGGTYAVLIALHGTSDNLAVKHTRRSQLTIALAP